MDSTALDALRANLPYRAYRSRYFGGNRARLRADAFWSMVTIAVAQRDYYLVNGVITLNLTGAAFVNQLTASDLGDLNEGSCDTGLCFTSDGRISITYVQPGVNQFYATYYVEGVDESFGVVGTAPADDYTFYRRSGEHLTFPNPSTWDEITYDVPNDVISGYEDILGFTDTAFARCYCAETVIQIATEFLRAQQLYHSNNTVFFDGTDGGRGPVQAVKDYAYGEVLGDPNFERDYPGWCDSCGRLYRLEFSNFTGPGGVEGINFLARARDSAVKSYFGFVVTEPSLLGFTELFIYAARVPGVFFDVDNITLGLPTKIQTGLWYPPRVELWDLTRLVNISGLPAAECVNRPNLELSWLDLTDCDPVPSDPCDKGACYTPILQPGDSFRVFLPISTELFPLIPIGGGAEFPLLLNAAPVGTATTTPVQPGIYDSGLTLFMLLKGDIPLLTPPGKYEFVIDGLPFCSSTFEVKMADCFTPVIRAENDGDFGSVLYSFQLRPLAPEFQEFRAPIEFLEVNYPSEVEIEETSTGLTRQLYARQRAQWEYRTEWLTERQARFLAFIFKHDRVTVNGVRYTFLPPETENAPKRGLVRLKGKAFEFAGGMWNLP